MLKSRKASSKPSHTSSTTGSGGTEDVNQIEERRRKTQGHIGYHLVSLKEKSEKENEKKNEEKKRRSESPVYCDCFFLAAAASTSASSTTIQTDLI